MRSFLKVTFLLISIVTLGSVGITAQSGDKQAYERFLSLTRSAPAAYLDGDIQGATQQAKELLSVSADYPSDWDYGNAVHTAHLVLGRIAADASDLKTAGDQLLKSVDLFKFRTASSLENSPASGLSKASPQMDTFGPDMSLARFLLEKGEKETVLKYLKECAGFWTMGTENLTAWQKQINAGEIPDFGPNMRYVFSK